jgi:hypothetical protein
MKLLTNLFALALLAATQINSHAQLIQSGPLDSTGAISFTVTFTQAEPVNVIATASATLTTGPGNVPENQVTVQVDGTTVAANRGVSVLESSGGGTNRTNTYAEEITIDYTANPALAAGQHTITVSFDGSGEGAATLIAPNEPPSGTSSAITTIENNIATLQANEASDAASISALQANQTSQASQISTLEANEAADAANIAALQNQLTTIQNTLQGEINTNSAAITALQNRATADEASAAQQQAEITALQNQPDPDAAAIAALQQQQAATAAQQQTDEANLAALQSQQTATQATVENLSTQIANDEAAQAQENTLLQNQITALQSGSSSVAGLQNQINSLNKSKNLTQTLSYAGLGVGVAGLAAGIDALFFGNDGSSQDASSAHSTTSGASNGRR